MSKRLKPKLKTMSKYAKLIILFISFIVLSDSGSKADPTDVPDSDTRLMCLNTYGCYIMGVECSPMEPILVQGMPDISLCREIIIRP